ncbi:MAG: hypothetical protein ABI969_05520 [bacterium]
MQHRAHARYTIAFTFLFAALITACGSTGPGGPGGPGGPIFGGIGGLSGGYSGSGFSSFGQKLDPQFIYLYFNDAVAEGPWNCNTDGYCGLGGMRNTFGAIAEADSFLFVSTANVDHDGANRVVRNSGVQTIPLTITNPAQYTAARVAFEFVFASARLNPTTHNDSAIVRIKAGTDSATIFKVTSADLQSGKFAARAGGCGTAAVITGRAIAYPNCTQWTATTADITAFKGRTFVIQFIVSEGSQSAADFVDQPSAFLFRKIALEGSK